MTSSRPSTTGGSTDADSLIVAVRAHDPGDTVTVTYLRGGQQRTAKAVLVASS